MDAPLIELSGIVKQYGALRPLRIAALQVTPGAQVVLRGLDQTAAEMFVNLVTGLTLPDEGEVRLFGTATAAITDPDVWLGTLDRLAMVSDRAPLLDALTVIQNIAMPFSLAVEPPPAAIAAQAEALAVEVGLVAARFGVRIADLSPLDRLRVRLARALAFNPHVVLLEHPSASLDRGDVAAMAEDVRRVATGRALATVALTADSDYVNASGASVLVLDPATGLLKRPGWFR